MRIAVLDLTGHPLPLLEGMPRVGQQTIDWLAPALPEAAFFSVDVTDGGEPMPALDTFDGLLLTGSEYGVYDETPWMEPLRQLLRATKDAGKPIYGICFGHQIMADTFGGKAEKSPDGVVMGVQPFEMDGRVENTLVWHQDQVTEVPPGATVTASAGYCPVGALDYDFPAASVQFHPEHRKDHLLEVYARARGSEGFPSADQMDAAAATLQAEDVAPDLMAQEVAAFFKAHAANS